MSPRQLNRVFTSASHMAGIAKPATLHTTHLLEANTEVRVIQVLLGHAKLRKRGTPMSPRRRSATP